MNKFSVYILYMYVYMCVNVCVCVSRRVLHVDLLGEMSDRQPDGTSRDVTSPGGVGLRGVFRGVT